MSRRLKRLTLALASAATVLSIVSLISLLRSAEFVFPKWRWGQPVLSIVGGRLFIAVSQSKLDWLEVIRSPSRLRLLPSEPLKFEFSKCRMREMPGAFIPLLPIAGVMYAGVIVMYVACRRGGGRRCECGYDVRGARYCPECGRNCDVD